MGQFAKMPPKYSAWLIRGIHWNRPGLAPDSNLRLGSPCDSEMQLGGSRREAAWGREMLARYRQDMPSAIEPQKPHSVVGAASRFGCWGPWACRSSRNASRMAPASRKADSKIKGLFRIALICPENGTIPRQPGRYIQIDPPARQVWVHPGGPISVLADLSDTLEGLLGLHREADGDLGRAVKNFKQVIAQQAAKFAGGARATGELNAPIAGIATWTDDVGLFHVANMRSCLRLSCIVQGYDSRATL
jgi:hypothetical protein